MKNLFSILIILNSSLAFCQWGVISPTYDGFDDSYKDIHFVNKDTGFVIAVIADAGYERVLLRTLDGAETWDTTWRTDIDMVLATSFLSIDFVNDTLGYISCNGDVLKTENCGETWISLDTSDVWGVTVNWYNILFVNKDTGFIAYQDGGSEFLRTYDGGWTWEEDSEMTGIRNFNEHNGVITGCWGGWAFLNMETLEWTKGLGLLEVEEISGLNFYHSIYNNGQLILTGSKSGSSAVYAVTENDGVTWRLYSFTGVLSLEEISFLSDLVGYAVGAFEGAINTWDGGETWFLMQTDNADSEISKRFQEFSMIDENIGYAISNDGIYKTTNGGGEPIMAISTTEYVSIEEFKIQEFSLYPNPVGDFINLQEIDIDAERIVIFDISGAIVLDQTVLSNEKIKVSNLSTGQYIVKIYSENGIYSTRILKR